MDDMVFNDGIIRQITVDENNVVQTCSIGGYIEGGIDVDEIPDEIMNCPVKWKFDNGNFVPNDEYKDNSFEKIKFEKIAESKTALAKWLTNHPMAYTDGKQYSVTAEKQSLLNGNLASYERAKTINVEYPLKWNSTGSECELWDYNNLLALSLTIAGYVAPKVSKQQELELRIKACTTVDEINEIEINYD